MGEEQPGQFKAQLFSRNQNEIGPGYRISSFSSFTGWRDDDPELPDYDQYIVEAFTEEADDGETKEKSLFTFPKGAQPGTCIHHIYENIDFQQVDNIDEVVLQQLSRFGIDTKWKEVVARHIRTTLKKPLPDDIPKLSLSSIPGRDRIPDLEFHFKSDAVELSRLLKLIEHPGPAGGGFAEPGFLKGFIDLTFRFNGKYYLLDYKTNHLGNTPQDYDLQNMKEEMIHHMYDLQYHLYSIALHRFLGNKISDYSYKSHFGGAFYLFIRGINGEGDEGIYFDKPEKERIEQLDAYLLGRELA
jgi:exodeoxyribonuclease V beta subunit